MSEAEQNPGGNWFSIHMHQFGNQRLFCVTLFTLQLSENTLTHLTFCARRLLTMGGGRGRTYGGRGALKGKGVGTAGKAVAKDATLHVDLLRAFPAEDGCCTATVRGLTQRCSSRPFWRNCWPLRIRSYSIGLLKAQYAGRQHHPRHGCTPAVRPSHGASGPHCPSQPAPRVVGFQPPWQLTEVFFCSFFPDARQPAGRTRRPVGTAGAHYVWALHAVLSTVLMF